ncbi:acyl-CoA dehydrogenase family member 10-like isoform X3 [Lampetra planeri]
MFGWNSLSLWRSPRLRSLLQLPPLPPCAMRLERPRWSHGASNVRAVIFDMGGVILPSPYPPIQEWEAASGLPGGMVLHMLRDGGEANVWCRYQRGEMSPERFDELFGADCSRIVVESCVVGMKKPDPRIYSLCLEELGVPPSAAVFLDDLGENLAPARALGLRTIKVGDLKVALAKLESLLGFSLSHDTGAVRAGLEIDERALAAYLHTALGLHADTLLVRQFRHGQSNPTYYVECGDRKLVLRKKPPGKLLPLAHAVEREYRVMKALGAAGVPVPQVLSLCEDSSVLGTPFFLMEYAEGRIFKDLSLPDLSPEQRHKVYSGVTSVLSQIHQVDPSSVGLTDFGKTGGYMRRHVQKWTKEYRASETKYLPSMELLMEWLPAHLPREEANRVVNGDFRLDNLVFDAERLEVRAVLDWEMSTLGDPLSDLSHSCLAHHLPQHFPMLPGLKDRDLMALGIPSDEEMMKAYCGASGRPLVKDWHFYLAFSFFRVAAILQGVYKRALLGQACSAHAEEAGQLVESMADVAWGLAAREGFRIFKEQPKPLGGGTAGQSGRPYSTSCRSTAVHRAQAPSCPQHDRRFFATSAGEPAAASGRGDGGRGGGMLVREAELAPPARATVDAMRTFVGERVIPAEAELWRWEPHPLLEQLKVGTRLVPHQHNRLGRYRRITIVAADATVIITATTDTAATSIQLFRPGHWGHGEHGGARALRHGPAAPTLAGAAARSQNLILLHHDGASGGLL